jgi:hypothetical protein
MPSQRRVQATIARGVEFAGQARRLFLLTRSDADHVPGGSEAPHIVRGVFLGVLGPICEKDTLARPRISDFTRVALD